MNHPTKDKIVACAMRLMQDQGYSNLGLRDLALEIGIKAPSLYNHFKSKTELAHVALLTYRELQLKKLHHINQFETLSDRLHAYIALFSDMLLNEGYICFAMILALEKKQLTSEIRQEIDVFYTQNIQWLEKNWQQGLTLKQIHSQVTPQQAAKIIFGALEGMMIFSNDEDSSKKNQFTEDASILIRQLGAAI